VRSPLPLLLGLSAAGLVALAVAPFAAIVFGGLLVVAGVSVRARGDAATGIGVAATGATLSLAAVVYLAVVDARQQDPVIVGPDTGLTPENP